MRPAHRVGVQGGAAAPGAGPRQPAAAGPCRPRSGVPPPLALLAGAWAAPAAVAVARRRGARGPIARSRARARGRWREVYGVYIEDTDCFGVVFYANYFRFFGRLLARAFAEGGHGEPVLLGVEAGRYARAARLGDSLQVELEELPEDPAWPGHRRFGASSRTSAGACVSAELRAAAAPVTLAAGSLGAWPPAEPKADQGPPTLISAFEDRSLPLASAMPMPSAVDVLRWFERSRTDSLGGPAQLEALQSEVGMLVVVARLEGFELHAEAMAAAASAVDPLEGAAYEVRSSVQLVSRGTRIVFDQRLYAAQSSAALADRCVARADVTCLCVDAASLKIARCPEALAARLLAWASREAAAP